jgi:hypothetical protein
MANTNQLEHHTQNMADGSTQDLGADISNTNTPEDGNNASPSLGLDNPLTNETTQITQISDGQTGARIQINDPPEYVQAAPFTEGKNEIGRTPSLNSRVAGVDQSRQSYAASNAGRSSDLMYNGRRRPMVLFSVPLIMSSRS